MAATTKNENYDVNKNATVGHDFQLDPDQIVEETEFSSQEQPNMQQPPEAYEFENEPNAQRGYNNKIAEYQTKIKERLEEAKRVYPWFHKIREGYKDKFYLRLLAGILAFGEFLLLLAVLLVLLEIGPQDIPSSCPTATLGKCMDEYTAAGGDFEAEYLGMTCGRATLQCWRGSYKTLLYGEKKDGKYASPDPGTLNVTSLGLSSSVAAKYGPSLIWCHCLLTRGHTKDMPPSPFTWRIDLDYFCDSLNAINRGWGFGGIFIGVMVLCVRNYMASFGEDANIFIKFHDLVIMLVLFSCWIIWSAVMIWTSFIHSALVRDDQVEDSCELPDSQLFFYVFYIALISLFGGVAAMTCTLFLLFFRLERNKPSHRAGTPVCFGMLRWMGDDQLHREAMANIDYEAEATERLKQL
eukprot:m.118836 g.118836  ORF g.118836 m.118836 type:complete len:410 (+) comp14293_c0_seq2:246-1475(+)